jgi:hypothetical protein
MFPTVKILSWITLHPHPQLSKIMFVYPKVFIFLLAIMTGIKQTDFQLIPVPVHIQESSCIAAKSEAFNFSKKIIT